MPPEIFITLLARDHELARSSALAALNEAIAMSANLDYIPRIDVDAILSLKACVDEIDTVSLRSAIAALRTDGFVFRNVHADRGMPRLVGSLGVSDWLQIYVGEHGVHFNVHTAPELRRGREDQTGATPSLSR